MNTENETNNESIKSLAVVGDLPVGNALPPADIKPPITPAQAKVEAVASLTMKAYERASMLKLSPEEISALQAEFPDSAFQPGAAGKEHLIYIEHAFLRDRLNQVFGPGQWAVIPRSRWAEPFTTNKGTEGSRVYVEAMLVVRGAFVAEAVGAMEYYPKNESQNYSDAVEGAKTAALRRCVKELGVGLQAWKHDWVNGWWARRRGGRDFSRKAPAMGPAQPQTPPPAPEAHPTPPAASAPPKPVSAPLKQATAATRTWMITALGAGDGMLNRETVTEYFQKAGCILETESLEDIPLQFIPTTKTQLEALRAKIADFEAGKPAEQAFPPNYPKAGEPEAVDCDSENAPWRSFPKPFGQFSGVPLADLDKKHLFGLWANFTVETLYQGKPRRPEAIAKDTLFRQMLDEAGKHYNFSK